MGAKTSGELGSTAEQKAIEYLEKKGLILITRNYHCQRGEIDLIMQDGNFLVFVEVRYRKNDSFGSAVESVTRSKQQRLSLTADYYLQNEKQVADMPCRFDVIGMTKMQDESIRWIKDAFQIKTY